MTRVIAIFFFLAFISLNAEDEAIIEDLERIHDSKILKQKFKDRLEDLIMELDELKELQKKFEGHIDKRTISNKKDQLYFKENYKL